MVARTTKKHAGNPLVDNTQNDPDGSPVAPLLMDARSAARLVNKSLRSWRTWDAAGLVPRPVRIGRSVLWRRQELEQWIDAGCPRRMDWEAQRGLC